MVGRSCVICNGIDYHNKNCKCCGEKIPIKNSHLRHHRCPNYINATHITLGFLKAFNTGKKHPDWRRKIESISHRGKVPGNFGKRGLTTAWWKIRGVINPMFTLEAKEKARQNLQLKPNQHEKYLDAILQLNFPKQWKYTGDWSFWVEGKNPDFVNCNGKKLVIEYYGFSIPKLNKGHNVLKDQLKTEHYSKYGFKTLNLYPQDLSQENTLIEKIQNFMLS